MLCAELRPSITNPRFANKTPKNGKRFKRGRHAISRFVAPAADRPMMRNYFVLPAKLQRSTGADSIPRTTWNDFFLGGEKRSFQRARSILIFANHVHVSPANSEAPAPLGLAMHNRPAAAAPVGWGPCRPRVFNSAYSCSLFPRAAAIMAAACCAPRRQQGRQRLRRPIERSPPGPIASSKPWAIAPRQFVVPRGNRHLRNVSSPDHSRSAR